MNSIYFWQFVPLILIYIIYFGISIKRKVNILDMMVLPLILSVIMYIGALETITLNLHGVELFDGLGHMSKFLSLLIPYNDKFWNIDGYYKLLRISELNLIVMFGIYIVGYVYKKILKK